MGTPRFASPELAAAVDRLADDTAAFIRSRAAELLGGASEAAAGSTDAEWTLVETRNDVTYRWPRHTDEYDRFEIWERGTGRERERWALAWMREPASFGRPRDNVMVARMH